MKSFFTVVFLGACIGLGIWGYGYKTKLNERKAIVSVLRQSTYIINKFSKEFGTSHKGFDFEKFSLIRSSLITCSSKISNISLRGCPPNFIASYRTYQAAWCDMADVMREYKTIEEKYLSCGGIFENFLRAIFGDLSMAYECDKDVKHVSAHFENARKSLDKTWRETLNIADDYGIDTSPYR